MQNEVTLTLDLDAARCVLATLGSRAHQLLAYLADMTGVSSPQTAMARNKAFLLENAVCYLNDLLEDAAVVAE
jgi:hypothetical protein